MTFLKMLPNLITSLRIGGTVSLFILEPLSLAFFVIYTFCGLTDVLDGFLARKLKVTSELGSLLDSIADLMFYGVMFAKILPILTRLLPRFVWMIVALAVLIRIASYLVAAAKYHRFVSLHTILNKATGFLVFLIPYFLDTSLGVAICAVGAVTALFSSAEELVIHLGSREYPASRKKTS